MSIMASRFKFWADGSDVLSGAERRRGLQRTWRGGGRGEESTRTLKTYAADWCYEPLFQIDLDRGQISPDSPVVRGVAELCGRRNDRASCSCLSHQSPRRPSARMDKWDVRPQSSVSSSRLVVDFCPNIAV